MANPTNQATEEPMTAGEKISHKMDQFKEFVSSGCCSCARKCPSIAVVLVGAIILLLILAAIPTVLIFTSSTSKLSSDSNELPQIIRRPKFWPKVDKINMDDDMDFHGISMQSLFPPNVSTCSGFGFACTDAIYNVIPTSKRCDGSYDCLDKSDEQNCKTCQTIFQCPSKPIEEDEKFKKSRKLKPQPTMICLTASQLCDGVQHCPDGSDETAWCKSQCSAEEFKCPGQNVCLPKSAKCNGIADCNDGSDEKDCNKCEAGAHKCGKICVKESEICDGIAQCDDGSDEKECDCKSCSGSDKALCDDGTCILRKQVCDGKRDCSNGMDEMDCPGSCFVKGSAMKKRVTCADGRKYTEEEACSGNFDACSSNCPKNCDSKSAFQCPSDKKCISRRMVCDGVADCGDAADERNCSCNEIEENRQFQCDRKCIDVAQKCDGVFDCFDLSDEKNCEKCASGAFRCAKDKSCLPSSTRCDGVVDCSDGSDEKNCSCDECVGAHSNTYMCDGSPRCLLRDEVCSPYSMCPNATRADKAYCATMVLRTQNRLPW